MLEGTVNRLGISKQEIKVKEKEVEGQKTRIIELSEYINSLEEKINQQTVDLQHLKQENEQQVLFIENQKKSILQQQNG